jgi:hypothetical protein
MKKISLSIICCLTSIFIFGQDAKNYQEQINEAWSLYESKDFLKSAQIYSKALGGMNDKGLMSDRYNAACSWALAKKPDSSFVQLFKIAEKGNYKDLSHMSTDTDLSSLHNDIRWQKVLDVVGTNNNISESSKDFALVAILDTIYEEYQNCRLEISRIVAEFGVESDEIKNCIALVVAKDSTNLIAVRKILDEHGWPGDDVVGSKGNYTLFLLLERAELPIQEMYLPLMRDAASKGASRSNHLALLEDNVALQKNGKQIYGSQVAFNNETQEYYVSPLADPDNVDKRRAELGLDSMQWYLTNWGLTWNVQDHKNKLAESKESLKK